MSERRALIVSAGGGESAGGVERFTALLDRALSAAGWLVEVETPRGYPPRSAFRLGLGPLWSARSAARHAASRSPVDLVVSNGALGAFLGSDRRIHVYHGTMPAHTLRGDVSLPLRERVRRIGGHGLAEALAGRGAVRVAVSESAAAEVERYYRLHVHEIIPNGVDTDLFVPRDRVEARARLGLERAARYALFVGRDESRKGVDLLAPACAEAGWELLSAGAELAGARSLGVLPPDRLALAYAAADAVLLPTRYEGCSFVVLEALASGTPLVTTDVGWMHTFLRSVPEYRALIVKPSVAEVAAGLRAAESVDPSITVRARERVVADCGLDRFAQRWVELAARVADREAPLRRDARARAAGGRQPG